MSDSRSYLGNSDYPFQIYFNEYGILGEKDKQMFDIKMNDEKQTQRVHVDSKVDLMEFFSGKDFTGTYAAVHGTRMHSLWVTKDSAVKFFDLVHAEMQKKNMSTSPSDVQAYKQFRDEINRLRENASPQPLNSSAASAPHAHSSSVALPAASGSSQIRSNL